MAEQLRKIEFHQEVKMNFDDFKDIIDIESRSTDEIVIGLCGPLGTPIHDTAEIIAEIMQREYSYEVKIIRLSEIIRSAYNDPIETTGDYDKITKLIDRGNYLREHYGPSILAELAIRDISLDRIADKEAKGLESFSPRRKCFIIDSIKTTGELEVFSQVYNSLFYVIGVYSPVDQRAKSLRSPTMSEENVYALIDRDSGEEKRNGQKVEKTFPKSDYFLRFDTLDTSVRRQKVSRMLKIILKTGVSSPTSAETAMYSAYSAAANSACMSRQVGACIIDKNGAIVSVGWNDVPKFGGSMYRAGDEPDNRCFNKDRQLCSSDSGKKELVDEISHKINTILDSLTDQSGQKVKASNSLKSDIRRAISESKIASLIEYSRAVHAEMHAIIGARDNSRLIGSELFCTTYPCHSCARHIVMAGIEKVYFIEPYRKSLATSLHIDSIAEEASEDGKVLILMYEGVNPKRFLELFKENEFPRKSNDGEYLFKRMAQNPNPKTRTLIESFPALEGIVLQNLRSKRILEEFNSDEEGEK